MLYMLSLFLPDIYGIHGIYIYIYAICYMLYIYTVHIMYPLQFYPWDGTHPETPVCPSQIHGSRSSPSCTTKTLPSMQRRYPHWPPSNDQVAMFFCALYIHGIYLVFYIDYQVYQLPGWVFLKTLGYSILQYQWFYHPICPILDEALHFDSHPSLLGWC